MTARSAVERPDSATTRETLFELVALHAQAMRRMPWVQALLVLGIGLAIQPFVSWSEFAVWAAVTVAIEIGRARYSMRVLRRGAALEPERVHAAFIALAAAAGAAVGLGSALFLPRLPLLQQALLGIILFATPAAGVAVSQSSRNIVTAYALCILIPAAVSWSLVHRSQAIVVPALTILYCAVIVLAAADGEKLLLRSVSIRHERDRLVRELEQRNVDVHAAVVLAEQSAQARARVLAAASHDLRQPLHALSVYSAVLASKPAPELLNEVSGNIDQIVRTLGSLLNGLLDLSRLSSGYFVPERKLLELEKLIANVCVEFQHAANQKGLALIRDTIPTGILGDAVAIGRIARNLIDNAIKYTDHGQVLVKLATQTTPYGHSAVLSVSDTGKGIPAAESDRIFEEFYQIDNPGRERSRGVGLGLAIVQRLCELIGARIEVQSVVDEGTNFRITFAAQSPQLQVGDLAPARTVPTSLQGLRVYVVDDEIGILKGMSALLSVWGVKTSTARTVEEADRLFAGQGPPDLLIVDLRLGADEHGAGMAARLQRSYGAFPVRIITGETASEALREANESGYPVLQKPIAPEVLHEAIASAVNGIYSADTDAITRFSAPGVQPPPSAR
jgi:two-component system, sensor histidine kinase